MSTNDEYLSAVPEAYRNYFRKALESVSQVGESSTDHKAFMEEAREACEEIAWEYKVVLYDRPEGLYARIYHALFHNSFEICDTPWEVNPAVLRLFDVYTTPAAAFSSEDLAALLGSPLEMIKGIALRVIAS